MPKKTRTNKGPDFIGMLKSGISSFISDRVNHTVNEIQGYITDAEEKAVQILYASSFFVAGAIFISIAAVMLINQYLNLSIGWSFMIMGLILIIASMVVKNKALNDSDRRRR
jgi:hypothetical protein